MNIFAVKLSRFTINEYFSIGNKHTRLPAKKWKNSSLAKKNSFIGSATGVHFLIQRVFLPSNELNADNFWLC